MMYRPFPLAFHLTGNNYVFFWWAVLVHHKKRGLSADSVFLVGLYYPRWYRVFVMGELS